MNNVKNFCLKERKNKLIRNLFSTFVNLSAEDRKYSKIYFIIQAIKIRDTLPLKLQNDKITLLLRHNISVARSTSFPALHCARSRGAVNNLSVAITYRCNEVSSFIPFPLQCMFANHSNATPLCRLINAVLSKW